MISASLFIAVGEATRTTTTTTTKTSISTSTVTETCGTITLNSTEVSSTNCQLGVTVSLGIEDTAISAGSNETFQLSVHNDLDSNSSLAQESAVLPPHISINISNSISSLRDGTDILPLYPQCGQTAWIAVYNEFGLPVQLNDATPTVVICGQTSTGLPPIQFTPYQTLTQDISIGGYWHSSNATAPWEDATFAQFGPGQYTVIAFDQWTLPIMLNFTVA